MDWTLTQNTPHAMSIIATSPLLPTQRHFTPPNVNAALWLYTPLHLKSSNTAKFAPSSCSCSCVRLVQLAATNTITPHAHQPPHNARHCHSHCSKTASTRTTTTTTRLMNAQYVSKYEVAKRTAPQLHISLTLLSLLRIARHSTAPLTTAGVGALLVRHCTLGRSACWLLALL